MVGVSVPLNPPCPLNLAVLYSMIWGGRPIRSRGADDRGRPRDAAPTSPAGKDTPLICPKCLTIETEGSLRCRKCGAQLYTGLFQKPVVDTPRQEQVEMPQGRSTARTTIIALVVFAVAVLVLLVVMSRLATMTP